jgi:integrase
VIPAERMKGKREFLLPLSRAALGVLARLPAIGKPDGFVFTHDGVRALGGYTQGKALLQKRSATSGWTLHDLRRTARTLMTRTEVPADHAERCLAHVIGGVRGIYDRHEFYEEKRAAFEALAAQIDRILQPAANVVQLRSIP